MTALQLDIYALARTVGRKVTRHSGRPNLLMFGPGHSRNDVSLSVTLDPAAPDGFLVKSFAGDDPIACRDHVRALAGLPAWTPSSRGRATAPAPVIIAPAVPDEKAEREAAWRRSRALAVWDESKDPRGTIVQVYLTRPKAEGGRGLVFPEEIAGVALRFHPLCPWKDASGQTIRVPAMIAAMRCIHTDQIKAIHRTWLTPDGCKVDRRMLGDAVETAIKLDPDDAVTMGITLGEGIETTLAARQLGFRPAWATGSVSTMGTFPVLPGIEALTLLTETDKTGANARAVETCGTRWHEAGRIVLAVASNRGGDINDAIQYEGEAA